MDVEKREIDDVLVVDLQGRLLAGVGDEVLHQTMNEVVAQGWQKIVLNLSEVSRIDSSGLGELVSGIKMAERLGSKVKLVNVQGKVLAILNLGQVTPLLDIYENEDAALESFGAPSQEA